MLESKIFLELKFAMGSFKTSNIRQSTDVLDMMGDIGGFHQSVSFFVFLFGEFFATQFFLQSIAHSLFLQKRSAIEIEEDLNEPDV